jgi:hypothetical protein
MQNYMVITTARTEEFQQAAEVGCPDTNEKRKKKC